MLVSGGQQVCDDPRRECLAVAVLGHGEGGGVSGNNGEVQLRRVSAIESEVGDIEASVESRRGYARSWS